MPSSEIESPEETLEASEVPEDLRREFLLQAGLLNLGVLITAGGLLVLSFTDSIGRGALLVVLGIALLVTTGWRYRRHAPP